MKTRIEIILGCMFSGKSTELIRRCNRYAAIGKRQLFINHTLDTRTTTNSVKTHAGQTHTALSLCSLMELIENKTYRDLLYNTDIIGIDEAQFFDDLIQFVIHIESLHKTVIIAGLDGDSDRKPFGQILNCIPLCDEVVKLTALDMISNDGTKAIFSKRLKTKEKVIAVGGKESYVAVSRANYFSK